MKAEVTLRTNTSNQAFTLQVRGTQYLARIFKFPTLRLKPTHPPRADREKLTNSMSLSDNGTQGRDAIFCGLLTKETEDLIIEIVTAPFLYPYLLIQFNLKEVFGFSETMSYILAVPLWLLIAFNLATALFWWLNKIKSYLSKCGKTSSHRAQEETVKDTVPGTSIVVKSTPRQVTVTKTTTKLLTGRSPPSLQPQGACHPLPGSSISSSVPPRAVSLPRFASSLPPHLQRRIASVSDRALAPRTPRAATSSLLPSSSVPTFRHTPATPRTATPRPTPRTVHYPDVVVPPDNSPWKKRDFSQFKDSAPVVFDAWLKMGLVDKNGKPTEKFLESEEFARAFRRDTP
ncbi:hypothetical protein EJ04DRAFT_581512 [Polyplosphaeria fusca]|uniref:Uncharacterized protein n=1 Tax=Polyplosphaeria fusca TaxID=682080 RepID=A0A9P4UVF7_9PLEO|nr:hypothetical protein EJ04DRAFT_581512 [Polyplosphaeria fusca]